MIHSVSDHPQVKERWNSLRKRVQERWPELNADELKMVDGDARRLIALVHQKTGVELHEVERIIDELAAEEGLMDRASRVSQDLVHRANEAVGRPLSQSYDYLYHEVERAPMRSVLVAAGSGLLIGLCCAALFFRQPPPKKHYRDYMPW